MKLKLIEPGFQGLTGYFGPVEFKDGVSIADVTAREASQIANLVRAEMIDGMNPSISQAVLDSGTMSMDRNLVRNADTGKVTTEDQITGTPATLPTRPHTRDELTAIADTQGIAGLRKIGEALGVKSQSIAGLIEAILTAQSGTTLAGPIPESTSVKE